MLKFDQNTIANMTAALEYVCMKVPPEINVPTLRNQIADAITAAAENKQVSLAQLKDAGLVVVNDLMFPPKKRWFASWDKFSNGHR